MNGTFYTIDRATHLKIVILALTVAIVVMTVAINLRIG